MAYIFAREEEPTAHVMARGPDPNGIACNPGGLSSEIVYIGPSKTAISSTCVRNAAKWSICQRLFGQRAAKAHMLGGADLQIVAHLPRLLHLPDAELSLSPHLKGPA